MVDWVPRHEQSPCGTFTRQRRALSVAGVALAGLLAAGGAHPVVSRPPDDAPPAVVLDAYLRALVAGDCGTAHALGTSTFSQYNGNLCGATQVSSYRVVGGPSSPNATERVYATTLVTDGTGDGSNLAGQLGWFYTLELQPNDTWRLTGGGTGP